MTPTNDIPRVITEAPAGKSYSLTYAQKMRRKRGESIYSLTYAQKMRRKRGESIYSRDMVVEPYRYNKGEFV